jgi:SNF2 family DNA or RNA helicase
MLKNSEEKLMYKKNIVKTWWGLKWIESLENIDKNKNRLPRGRTYFNKGNVIDINYKDGMIISKVKGNYKDHYNQTIKLNAFKKDEKNKIKAILKNRKDFMAQLLIGFFPPDLFEILTQSQIHLFPEKWADILSKCSCPDRANPCKHLAAVFYSFAHEFDKNPFLIFELHGLKKSEIVEESEENIIKFSKQFKMKKEIKEPEIIAELLEIQNLLNLLPDDILFTNIDLKSDLKKLYEEINQEENIKIENLKLTDLEIKINYNQQNPKIQLKTNIDYLNHEYNYYDFFEILEKANYYNLEDSNIKFFSKLLKYFEIIKYTKSFLPQAQKIDETNFHITYKPYTINETYKKYHEYLKSLIKEPIIKNKNEIADQDFIINFLFNLYIKNKIKYIIEPKENKIHELFFTNYIYKPKKFDEKNTFTSIKNYLEPITIDANEFFIFNIKNYKSKYSLSIDIAKKDDPFTTKELREHLKQNNDQTILKKLAIISKYSPFIMEYLNLKFKDLIIEPSDLSDLIINTKNIIKLLNSRINYPIGMEKIYTPELIIKTKTTEKDITLETISKQLNFDFNFKIGSTEIEFEEFIKKYNTENGIKKIENQYFVYEKHAIENIKQIVKKIKELDNISLFKFILSKNIFGIDIIIDENLKNYIKNFKKYKQINIPKKLNATLRPYQKKGYKWIYTNFEKGFNICLADDMGLGKTIQILSVIQKIKENKKLTNPSIVICPTSLLANWEKESSKFTPEIKTHIYHGNERDIEKIKENELIITSYGIIRRDIEKLQKIKFQICVIDEAQNIKNPYTSQSIAVKKINSQHKVALTGTPVENKLLELWSIYDFLMPGFLGNQEDFKINYAYPIEKLSRNAEKKYLKNAIEPFLMRRLKTDKKIIKDLPEKFVYDEYVYLTPIQKKYYQKIMDLKFSNIEKNHQKRKAHIFALITALKQICNHPANYDKNFIQTINSSGKMQKTIDILQTIIENEEKVIIFTQYTTMGNILQKLIKEYFKMEILFFHGSLNQKQRNEMIEKFETISKYKVMIISLKAGGTGLNLTAANHVIHYDLWWNPAVENQATDRVFRIGQEKNVIVHRLITTGTFEEKINEIINKKERLTKEIITTSEKWIGDLTNEELKKLFTLK